jgi:hypothetical protein
MIFKDFIRIERPGISGRNGGDVYHRGGPPRAQRRGTVTDNSNRQVEQLMTLPYELVVRPDAAGVTVLCPDLRLSAHAPTAVEALAAVDAVKRDFFARCVAAGESPPRPGSHGATAAESTRPAASAANLGAVAIKAAVATFSTLMTLLIVAVVAGTLLLSATPMLIRAAYGSLMAGMVEIAKVTPEREREIRAAVAGAAEKLRPIIAELIPLASDRDCAK